MHILRLLIIGMDAVKIKQGDVLSVSHSLSNLLQTPLIDMESFFSHPCCFQLKPPEVRISHKLLKETAMVGIKIKREHFLPSS